MTHEQATLTIDSITDLIDHESRSIDMLLAELAVEFGYKALVLEVKREPRFREGAYEWELYIQEHDESTCKLWGMLTDEKIPAMEYRFVREWLEEILRTVGPPALTAGQ